MKCISKLDDVLWCHVVLKDTMDYKAGDLLWEAIKGVDTQGFKDKIQTCATNHKLKIKFGPTIILENESFKNGNSGKHPKKE